MTNHYQPDSDARSVAERPAGAPTPLEWIARGRVVRASAPVTPHHLPDSDGSQAFEQLGVRHDHYLPDPSCPSHPSYG